ncbi:hypothetical protein ABTK20_22405, partial [Acinetobacter baumannii]
ALLREKSGPKLLAIIDQLKGLVDATIKRADKLSADTTEMIGGIVIQTLAAIIIALIVIVVLAVYLTRKQVTTPISEIEAG